jgi:hypothetical protein
VKDTIAVKIGGCDCSTTVLMDLDDEGLTIVNRLAELVNASEKACAPTIGYRSVAEWTVTFEADAGLGLDFDARPDGYVSVYAFDREVAEHVANSEIGWGRSGWTLHAEGDMDRDAFPAGRLATWISTA